MAQEDDLRALGKVMDFMCNSQDFGQHSFVWFFLPCPALGQRA